MVAVSLRAGEHVGERHEKIIELDSRQRTLDSNMRGRGPDLEDVASDPRQLVEPLCRLLVALVLLQPAHELGARIVLVVDALGPGQQQPGLDLRQHRRHREVLGRKLQSKLLHQIDVLHVLLRDGGDRDVEQVEVLALDQIEQQIEGTLERFEKDLQGVRWDIEIPRQLDDRLAVDHGERHLLLPGPARRRGSSRLRHRRLDPVHVHSSCHVRHTGAEAGHRFHGPAPAGRASVRLASPPLRNRARAAGC